MTEHTTESRPTSEPGQYRGTPRWAALVPADADASDVFSSIGETMAPPSGEFSTQGSGSGCCWGAYNVQRSWDCCGILLNEYWTEIKFNKCSGGFCSPYLRTYSGQDGGTWKTLSFSCGPGWYPVSSDHYFYRSSGGVGYTSVTLKGHQGFGYKAASTAAETTTTTRTGVR